MKINFIMPSNPKIPSGGFKVIYEYAKMLSFDGYEVIITYPFLHSFNGVPPKTGIINQIKYNLRYIKDKFFRKITCRKWFDLPKEIKEKFIYSLEDKYVEKSDIVFATAWSTAEEVAKYSENKGRKFYLIQSFEDWGGPRERVIETWKQPMKKIVISKHLKQIADELGEKSELIENGLNFKDFYYDRNLKKDINSILMLYHSNEEVKRSREAVNEIIKLKEEKGIDIKFRLFGVNKRPDFLPKWIEYYQKPKVEDLRKLYNKSEIFVSPSKIEGWALPPAEAMQCKTLVCVTDIPGHEYVEHMVTGYKIKRLRDLPEVLENLLNNNELRKKLSENGHKYISQYTWKKSYEKLKRVLGIKKCR